MTRDGVRATDVLMADGRIASIRRAVPSDREALLALHEQVGDDNLRLRFFIASRTAGPRYVEHLLGVSDETAVTLVATTPGRMVAVASAERVDDEAAEVAFLVADDVHGRGLGSLLLEHLAAACRDRGIRRFVAEVLPENSMMIRVLQDAGFEVSRRHEHGVLRVEMSTDASDAAVAAADLREFASEARSLAPLLHPHAVAVVGVRRDASGLGHAVLTSILEGGFRGELFVVHPWLRTASGVPAFPRLVDAPVHVDLAVVAVPASRVLEAVDDAARAGVSAVVVITSGLAEMGVEGARTQQRLLRLAREHDLRLVGPNCLGVMCNDPGVRLNATFTHSVPPVGGLAIASQSGGVGIALLDVARHLGLGVRSFISLGNKADVSSNDLLAAWIDDPDVTAAALYLESFGNAPKFARLARRFAERKPLLAVVGGRSSGGRRAGASHTAAVASPAVGIDALFAQAGVIRCRSAEAMGRTALLLAEQPLPTGRRIAVVSNAGGLGVLAADAADSAGLAVPELSAGLRSELAAHVEGTSGTSNPVDLGAGASAGQMDGVLGPLLGSDEVDAFLVVVVPTSVASAEPLLTTTARLRADHPGKPVILVGLGGLGTGLRGVTVYHAVDHAVEALAAVCRYAEWRRAPHATPTRVDPDRAAEARATAHALGHGTDSSRWLSPGEAERLLVPYGLAPLGGVAEDAAGATMLAEGLGFPVVVKVADRDVVHKSDRGLVRVGLTSRSGVEAAVHDFARELGGAQVPVLVQPVVGGVEVALGVVRDPRFGPLVMVAAGGVATEILDDRSFLMPPVTRQDAARAIRSLRIWPLLDGFRGAPRADTDALEGVVVALGTLATDVPDVAEIDLNPVMCSSTGIALIDVKVRIAESEPLDAGIPRGLRMPR